MNLKSNGNINVFQTFPKEIRLSLNSARDKEAGQYTLAREKFRTHMPLDLLARMHSVIVVAFL